MVIKAKSPEEYISNAPEERKEVLKKLCKIIKKNLPNCFEEGIQYGMISYYVPHTIYPKGYHCNAKEPLPFMSFASLQDKYHGSCCVD